MFASVFSAAISGMEVHLIKVEADVSDGLPSFTMVGLPSTQVKEAQDLHWRLPEYFLRNNWEM